MAPAPLHSQISVTPFATHNHTGPLCCRFPSGWAFARPRALWVSPTTSPVRLGVSPDAASTPMGVFNQRFEALFPHWSLCFTRLPFLLVYLCTNAGLRGLLVTAWPAPFHNPSPRFVHQPPPCRESSPPQLPVSAPPTGLDECLFFIYLVSDFLACLLYTSDAADDWLVV